MCAGILAIKLGPASHRMGDRRMRLRYLLLSIAIVGLLAVVAVFVAPTARAAMLVNLVTGLAWPLVLLVAVIVFWPQLRELASVTIARIRQGAAFQLGIFSVSSVSESAARIPSPNATESVSLENVALLHTSFIRPTRPRGATTAAPTTRSRSSSSRQTMS